jgi:hypothetical protein
VGAILAMPKLRIVTSEFGTGRQENVPGTREIPNTRGVCVCTRGSAGVAKWPREVISQKPSRSHVTIRDSFISHPKALTFSRYDS